MNPLLAGTGPATLIYTRTLRPAGAGGPDDAGKSTHEAAGWAEFNAGSLRPHAPRTPSRPGIRLLAKVCPLDGIEMTNCTAEPADHRRTEPEPSAGGPHLARRRRTQSKVVILIEPAR